MAFSDSNRAPAFIRVADLHPGELLVVICAACQWNSHPRYLPPNKPISEIKFRCGMCGETEYGVYVYDRRRYWDGDRDHPIIVIRPHTPRPRKQESC